MGFALNIMFLCIMIISIILGVRKGFIKSAVKLVGRILSIVIAGIFGSAAASWLFRSFFREPFLDRVRVMLLEASSGMGAESVMAGLPDFLVRALEQYGISAMKLSSLIDGQQARAAEVIVDAIEPILVGILKVMCVIVLFILLMVIVRIVAESLSRAFEFAMLGPVDGLLGGVFGLLSALVVVWIVFSVINVFLPMTSENVQALVNNGINESGIAKVLLGLNPFNSLVK